VGVSDGVAPIVREEVGLGVWLGVSVDVGVGVLEREEPIDGVCVGVLVIVGVVEGVEEGDGPATSEKDAEIPVYVRPL